MHNCWDDWSLGDNKSTGINKQMKVMNFNIKI